MVSSNDKLAEVDEDARKLVDQRDPIYSNAWEYMSLEDYFFEIRQKLSRIEHMPKDSPERFQQMIDIVNYSRFAAHSIKTRGL